MRRSPRLLLIIGLTIILGALIPGGPAWSQPRSINIGVIIDGPWERNQAIMDLFRDEITGLTSGEFDVRFPDDKRIVCDWTLDRIRASLDGMLADPGVNLILTMGVISSHLAATRGPLPKPVIAPFVINTDVQEIPCTQGTSGVKNLCYMVWPDGVARDLEVFREIAKCRTVAFLCNDLYFSAIPRLQENMVDAGDSSGAKMIPIGVATSAESTLAMIPPDAEAVYMAPLVRLARGEFDKLIAGLNARKLPTFSMLGREDVERGVLAGLTNQSSFDRLARRAALNVQGVLLGQDPSSFPVTVTRDERLTINMKTAREIGVYPAWALLTEAELINPQRTEAKRHLTLADAVHEGMESNLDLSAFGHEVSAGRQDIRSAIANLLPQVNASALGLIIDEDRAKSAGGSAPEKSLSGTLSVDQLLFAEPAWANVAIQRSLQQSRESAKVQLDMDIAQSTATTYLNVLRAKTYERIQRDNLRLTRSNLELAQLRRAVGMAGPAEVYRWESLIATSRKDVIDANSQRNLAEMSLNRVLHHPLEEEFTTNETGLDDPSLISSEARFFEFFADPWTFRKFRDFMQEEAIANSPELAQYDAAIASQSRSYRSTRWSFWSPTLAVRGELSKEFSRSGAGSDYLGLLPIPDDVDWNVGLQISLPLFQGGERFARKTQAHEQLTQYEIERAAAEERVSLRVRSALHNAGASHASIGLSRDAASAAAKNLELVTDAYSRGAVSIIELIDAQNTRLVADQVAANAVYDFLIDLMEVERAAGRLDFFMDPATRTQWFDRARAYIEARGDSGPESK